jgi:hypothetical protein
MCDNSDVNRHCDDLNNSLDIRSNILFDFIDNIVQYFGPPSFDCNTPHTNRVNFEMWRQEIYAIITKEVDLSNMVEIEMDKCNAFWVQ